MVMLPLALLLTAALPQAAAPVLVAVSTEGLPDRERDAVVAHVVAEVQATGATPTPLPPGVVSAACAADAACARNLFAGGTAARLVVVDVLRAGSRASISARVVDRDGRTIAEHAGVLPMAKLTAGKEPLLPDTLLDDLVVVAAPTPPVVATLTPTPTPAPAVTPAPATTAPPAATDPPVDPGMGAILGVSATAVGALFLIGGTAAALGQNAVRLDANADGDARAATALTIPLALGVATLGAVGVGVGVVMLMGDGDDTAVAAGG